MVHIIPDASFIVIVIARIAVAETYAGRLVNPEDGGLVRPAVRVGYCCEVTTTVFGDRARAILVEQRKLPAAAWSSRHP